MLPVSHHPKTGDWNFEIRDEGNEHVVDGTSTTTLCCVWLTCGVWYVHTSRTYVRERTRVATNTYSIAMSALSRAARVVAVAGVAATGLYKLFSDTAHRGRVQSATPPADTTPNDTHRTHRRRPKIRETAVLFGDSITQYSFGNKTTGEVGGWGALVATEYARTLDVVNRGFSGYTTRGALSVCDHVLGTDDGGVGSPAARSSSSLPSSPPCSACSSASRTKPFLFVTIFFGANDSADPAVNKAQHVPVAEFHANLARLVDKARTVAQHVVVISPPPIDATAWAKERGMARSDRQNVLTEQYCEAGRAVAAAKGALFVDTFHAMLAHDDWRTFLNDGLHLSPRGNRKLFTLLLEALRDGAHVADESLPLDFPLWRDLNDLDMTATGHFSAASVKALPYECRDYGDDV